MTTMTETRPGTLTLPFTFRVGIPPRSLGKGSSAEWYVVRRDFAAVKTETMVAVRNRLTERRQDIGEPFPALVFDMIWAYWHPSHKPDPDNTITRTSAIRDQLQDMGIVGNDADISIGAVTFQQVRKGCEGVTITLREAGSE